MSEPAHTKIEELENAHWRDLLARLLSHNARTRCEAESQHAKLSRGRRALEAGSAYQVSVPDAVRLIKIAATIDFPARRAVDSRMVARVRGSTPSLICRCLVGLTSPELTAAVGASYPEVSDELLREQLIVILIGQQTPEAVESFLRIARDQGLRPAEVCSRLRHLDAGLLGAVLPLLDEDTRLMLLKARELQQLPVFQRIWSDNYSGLRQALARNLDLLGAIPGSSLAPLREGLSTPDPLIRLSAARSLLPKGEDCGEVVIRVLAASHETRVGIFELLEVQQQLGRFPARFRNFEAFAAVPMAAWLGFHSGISFEPERLQFVARMTKMTDVGEALHIRWCYRSRKNRDCLFDAGPYPASTGDRPFSVSRDWDAESLSQPLFHLSLMLDRPE